MMYQMFAPQRLSALTSTDVNDSATASLSGSKSNQPDMPPLNAKARHPWLIRARNAAVTAGMRLAFGLIPAIPDAAKRLMARSITLDGNTLDPTLRLMLAGQKLTGVE